MAKKQKTPKVYSKQLSSHSYENDIEKYAQFYKISQSANFRTPEVIGVEPSSHTIHFDYIDDLISIRDHYLCFLSHPVLQDKQTTLNLFKECGKALAFIHKGFSLSQELSWDPPQKYKNIIHSFLSPKEISMFLETPQTIIHSDFGFSNVLTKGKTDELIIIDCLPNFHTSFHCNEKCSIYIDLANFLSCLDGLIWISPQKFISVYWSRRQLLKDAFLHGYQEQSCTMLNLPLLKKLTQATAMCYFRRKYGLLKAYTAYSILYSPLKYVR